MGRVDEAQADVGIPMSPVPMEVELGNTQLQQLQWLSNLCDCCDDPKNAFFTCFCPCVTFGQIAEIVDNGTTSCGMSGAIYGLICCMVLVPWAYSCTYRAKLRSKFGLVEAPMSDCLTHCLCECCSLCQEYRELQLRGYDPSIGWLGNVQRNPAFAQQGMMAPPMNQMMMG